MARAASQPGSVLASTQLALAKMYAGALMSEAQTNERAAQIAEELTELVDLLERTHNAEALLAAAPLSTRERCEMVRRVFHGRVSELVEAFLGVLARRNRLGILRAAAGQFQKLLDKRMGKVELTVTTAEPLDDRQRQDLIADLRRTFHAEPILTLRVEKDLLGGARVRLGDDAYDSSVATQLRRFSEGLSKRVAAGVQRCPDRQ